MAAMSDDSHMSIDNLSSSSPRKTFDQKLSVPSKNFPESKKSWYEMIEDEERLMLEESKVDIKNEGFEAAASSSEVFSFSGIVKREIKKEEESMKQEARDIQIDFLDAANVEKYDNLVKKEIIKSPFKRRLSSNNSEMSNSSDDTSKFNKRSKTYDRDTPSRDRHESSSSGESTYRKIEYEKDPETLDRRQKQIDYGKNTVGYDIYMSQISRDQRTREHPKTPPRHIKYSRRAWDGLIRVWRKKLHCFDPGYVQKNGAN